MVLRKFYCLLILFSDLTNTRVGKKSLKNSSDYAIFHQSNSRNYGNSSTACQRSTRTNQVSFSGFSEKFQGFT